MSRHQYGISALISQSSFRVETSGGVEKCRLFSQAREAVFSAQHRCSTAYVFLPCCSHLFSCRSQGNA